MSSTTEAQSAADATKVEAKTVVKAEEAVAPNNQTVAEVVVEANGHDHDDDHDDVTKDQEAKSLIAQNTEESSIELSITEVLPVVKAVEKAAAEEKAVEKAATEEKEEEKAAEEEAVVATEGAADKATVAATTEEPPKEEEKPVAEEVKKAVPEEVKKASAEDLKAATVEELVEKLNGGQESPKEEELILENEPVVVLAASAPTVDAAEHQKEVKEAVEAVDAAIAEEFEGGKEQPAVLSAKQGVSFQEPDAVECGTVVESLEGEMATNGEVDHDEMLTGSEDNSSALDVPEIELIIKASTIDGRRRGACIFCQEYFMDLYLLAELKAISLKITTVDMKRPPTDFRSNFEAAQPPILIDTGVAILENEKIERHIMKHIPGGHNLFVPDSMVEKKLESLYNKFKVMLVRQDEMSKKHVVSYLKKIDEMLEERGSRFLTGDTLCCFDCELMPKLQHIRVAGRFFLDFDIPADLTYLWRYIKEMYELDAFTQSCPADQDIIHIYKMQRMSTANTLPKATKSREELEAPTYLTSVPEGI